MKPRVFLIRKYRNQLTDSQAIILLHLGEFHTASLTEIADAAGLPVTSIHTSLTIMKVRKWVRQLFAVPRQGKFYALTDEGKEELRRLLA